MAKKNDPYVRGAVEVINKLMTSQNVSKADLAEKLGESTSYVYQVLSPSYGSASPDTLERFANALDVTLTASVSATPMPLLKTKGSGKLKPTKGGKKTDV